MADGALGDPELVVLTGDGLGGDLLAARDSDGGGVLFFFFAGALVLDGGLEGLGARRLRSFFRGLGGSFVQVVVGVLALGAALDDESVRVGEFDFDVLLVDAREFAVEMVTVLDFPDVESRREGGDMLETTAGLLAGAVDIVVIQEAEEGSEIARREACREECHFFGRSRSVFL